MNKKGITIQKAAEIRTNKDLEPTKLGRMRVFRNMSQSQLAKEAGVTLRAIQCYEQRVRTIEGAKLRTLLSLCIVLRCSLCDILEDDDTIQKFCFVNDTFYYGR